MNEYDLYNTSMMNDRLYHFGIKGMHWGIRKDPYSGYNAKKRPRKVKSTKNQNGKKKEVSGINHKQARKLAATKRSGLTANQKLAIGAAIGAAVLIGGSIYLSHKNDALGGSMAVRHNITRGQMCLNGFVADLGNTPLHRIADEDANPEDLKKRPFYASYLPEDVLGYRGTFAYSGDKEFVIEPKNQKINIASAKEASDVFREAMRSDSKFRETILHLRGLDRLNPDAIKRGLIDNDSALDSLYRDINFEANMHGPRTQAVTEAVFSKLRDRGYQAVTDMNDSTGPLPRKSAMIVIDPKSVVGDIKSIKLTDDMIDKAKNEYYEIQRKKHERTKPTNKSINTAAALNKTLAYIDEGKEYIIDYLKRSSDAMQVWHSEY